MDVPRAAPPPRILVQVLKYLDLVAEVSGRVFSWLVVALVATICYEVFARYFFDAPTIWAFDISVNLYASLFMLGAGYTLLKKGHIRTDLLYSRFPPRVQGAIDATLYLLFFFPGMAFFFLAGLDEAVHAWIIEEKSDASPWRPPLYPLKTVIPATAVLLLLQGVSEFIKSVYASAKGTWL